MVSPMIGHHVVKIPERSRLWQNDSTKMFHLSAAENTAVLSCGRKATSATRILGSTLRFDSSKRKQCFRQLRS